MFRRREVNSSANDKDSGLDRKSVVRSALISCVDEFDDHSKYWRDEFFHDNFKIVYHFRFVVDPEE